VLLLFAPLLPHQNSSIEALADALRYKLHTYQVHQCPALSTKTLCAHSRKAFNKPPTHHPARQLQRDDSSCCSCPAGWCLRKPVECFFRQSS
jgi:hypothetical protein